MFVLKYNILFRKISIRDIEQKSPKNCPREYPSLHTARALGLVHVKLS